MKILVLLALLFSAAASAVAPEVLPKNTTVTWTQPTAYNDGTPMPASDIDHVTISWVLVGTGLTGYLQAPYSPPIISISTTCGKYEFSGTYTTTSTAHVPNARSYPATKIYDTGVVCPPGVVPAAPTLLRAV